MLYKYSKHFFILVILGGIGISAFGLGKVCLFSSMQGSITIDGSPVRNAQLKRIINYKKPQEDYTTTDENGFFKFESVFASGTAKLIPQEFTVGQEVSVIYNGSEYSIWSTVKRNSQEFSESDGTQLQITCELSSEKRFVQVDNQPFMTRCEWNASFDEVDTGF